MASRGEELQARRESRCGVSVSMRQVIAMDWDVRIWELWFEDAIERGWTHLMFHHPHHVPDHYLPAYGSEDRKEKIIKALAFISVNSSIGWRGAVDLPLSLHGVMIEQIQDRQKIKVEMLNLLMKFLSGKKRG